MLQVYKDTEFCCGCTACKSICPKDAIAMHEDEKGFLYPVINEDLCIDCGRCVSVCPFEHSQAVSNEAKPLILAAAHNNKDVVKKSSSGGAFTLISDVILERGGSVFGCVIADNFDVCHTIANTSAERDKMRGSKYVQSDMLDVFSEIKEACKTRPVLFVGTPCQVAGLNLYLGKIPDNLITVDFLCHGTPSTKLFHDHIKFLETKYNKKAVDYKFRDKKYGWRHVETVFFSDGSSKTSYLTFRLKRLFMLNIALRKTCYNCKFARHERISDITIGDFWGAEKAIEVYDNTGISIMMGNSEKGKALLKEISSENILKEVTIQDIEQRALTRPAKLPKNADVFWKEYLEHGYEYVAMKYAEKKTSHYLRFVPVSIIVTLKLDKFFNILKAKIRKCRR